MKFDYTEGKEAKFKVSVIYSTQDDFYYFSKLEKANELFNEIVKEHGDEVATVTLRDLSKRGTSAILNRYSNFDEVRDSTGKQIAYYEPKDKVIYIRTDAIVPKGVTRKEFGKAFEKSYDERIELYATESDKASIRAFIAKHAGAKISEFTPMYF